MNTKTVGLNDRRSKAHSSVTSLSSLNRKHYPKLQDLQCYHQQSPPAGWLVGCSGDLGVRLSIDS